MSVQEELLRLYWRVVTECNASWETMEAFHALSETIEYNGGGKHINFRGADDDDGLVPLPFGLGAVPPVRND